MKVLRAIPLDSLCPECERGWMKKNSMPAKGKKLGSHLRKIPTKCDRCGFTESTAFKYFGVEE